MKLSTNFVNPPDSLVTLGAVSVWCCAALLAATSIWLWTDSVQSRHETMSLRDRHGKLLVKYQLLDIKLEDGPTVVEMERLRRTIDILNGLAPSKGMSASAMLSAMESKLPDEAYIVRLVYKPENGGLNLVAESPSAAPLTAFLHALEQEPSFKEVLLSRQLHMRRKSIDYTQYEISLRGTF